MRHKLVKVRESPEATGDQFLSTFANQARAEVQLCGSNSASLVMGWEAILERTSLNQVKGSIPIRWQDATKLRSTAAVLPPWSLPKNIQLFVKVRESPEAI